MLVICLILTWFGYLDVWIFEQRFVRVSDVLTGLLDTGLKGLRLQAYWLVSVTGFEG